MLLVDLLSPSFSLNDNRVAILIFLGLALLITILLPLFEHQNTRSVSDSVLLAHTFEVGQGQLMILPVMNGREFLKAFRAKENATKVILCLVYTEDNDLSDIYALDIYAYVKKPFRVNFLAKLLKEALA